MVGWILQVFGNQGFLDLVCLCCKISLNCSIWHSFGSFFYCRVYLQQLGLSIYDVIVDQKKIQSTFSGWGYYFSCSLSQILYCIKSGFLSLLFLASTVNDIRRKLLMVEIHSTVRKRAKRMPDATVKTTTNLYIARGKLLF